MEIFTVENIFYFLYHYFRLLLPCTVQETKGDILMYHIGICDDEPVFIEHLEKMVEKIMSAAGISYLISTFSGIPELENCLEDSRTPIDLLLLDILMAGKNGMDFAREQSLSCRMPPFIFITCTMDFALEGYHVDSLAYLVKPVKEDELKKALLKAWKKYQKQTIVLTCTGQTVSLLLNDLLYIEVHDKLLSIHMADGTVHRAAVSLKSVLEKLPPEQFIRCHKSFVVSLPEICSICRYYIELKNHDRIPISKSCYTPVQEALIQWAEISSK